MSVLPGWSEFDPIPRPRAATVLKNTTARARGLPDSKAYQEALIIRAVALAKEGKWDPETDPHF